MTDIDILDRVFLSCVSSSLRMWNGIATFSCDRSVRVRHGDLVGTVMAASNSDGQVKLCCNWEVESPMTEMHSWVPLRELELV